MVTLGVDSILAILAVLFVLFLPLNMDMADSALDIKIQADHILEVFDDFGSTRNDTEKIIEDYLGGLSEVSSLAAVAQELPEGLDEEFAEEMLELLLAAEIVKNSPDGVYYSYEQLKEAGALLYKPARAPSLRSFFVTGGRCITIFNNGTCWLFDANVETSAKGRINVKVLYVMGHVIFPDNAVYRKIPKTGSYIDIGPFGTREADNAMLKKIMQSLGMTSVPAGYVAHHSSLINGHIVYVLTEVHQKFAHNGGHYAWGCD